MSMIEELTKLTTVVGLGTKNRVLAEAEQEAKRFENMWPHNDRKATLYRDAKLAELFFGTLAKELKNAVVVFLDHGGECSGLKLRYGGRRIQYKQDPEVQRLTEELDERKKLVKIATESGETITHHGETVEPVEVKLEDEAIILS